MTTISLTVNGRPRRVSVEDHHTLLEALRDDMGLTGTKECCLVGECGACSVRLNDQVVDSCLVLAAEADGGVVTTVEGLQTGTRLSRLQIAFLERGAVQCGFCIPGQLIAADDLLRRVPRPTRGQIEEGLAGNLCRCGCYYQIIEAVVEAADPDAEPDVGLGVDRNGRAHAHAATADPPSTSDLRRAMIGAAAPRVGGLGRLTGDTRYVADIHLPDELHARLVTVPTAHARIIRVDTSAALALPGVAMVFSAADVPAGTPRFGAQFDDRPVIAAGEVKFHGDPVAIVAAETKDLAEEAARLVRVEYEELPAVFTVAGARAADAPLVQDPSLRPGDPLASTNVLREHCLEWGDLGAKHADLVVENRYRFPMVTHFAIEPHAFIAAPDGAGIAVWSSIQHPFWLRRIVARVLDLPLSRVRIHAPDPGGAFGGKQHAKYEPALALMALALGRPVRLVLSLEETFQAVRRAEAQITVRTGLRADGTFCFQDIDADYLIGAYVDIADRVVGKGSYVGHGPYVWPAARLRARSVLSHTVPSTAFRGFGTPQVIWAVESNITEAALRLGLDPLEVRLRNLADLGDPFIPGDTPCDGRWAQSLKRAAELIGWDTPPPAGRGRGIALGIKSGPTTGLSNALVRLLADGSVLVYTGTQDMGQGARTIFAQLAAAELGAELDAVTTIMGDTSVVPYDQQTSASRSSVLMGNAIVAACSDVKDRLRTMLGGRYDAARSAVEQVSAALGPQGGEIIGLGQGRKGADAAHPLGGTAAFWEFNATAVELSVDEGTGDITISRYATVSDVGRSLNRLQVTMQDEGAAIMGLGHTLMEQYIFDEHGRIRNLGAIDYRIPTSMDLPLEMISDTVENGDGPGPYGAKGMSEGALLPVAAAVAAAVRDATGVAIRELPLSPERVWHALQQREPTA